MLVLAAPKPTPPARERVGHSRCTLPHTVPSTGATPNTLSATTFTARRRSCRTTHRLHPSGPPANTHRTSSSPPTAARTAHLHEIRLNTEHTTPPATCHHGRTQAPAGDRQGPAANMIYLRDARADNATGDEAHSGRRRSVSGHSREARAVNEFLAEGEARRLIEEGDQEASAITRQGESMDKLQ